MVARQSVAVAVPVQVQARTGADLRKQKWFSEKLRHSEKTGKKGGGATHLIGLRRRDEAVEDETGLLLHCPSDRLPEGFVVVSVRWIACLELLVAAGEDQRMQGTGKA